MESVSHVGVKDTIPKSVLRQYCVHTALSVPRSFGGNMIRLVACMLHLKDGWLLHRETGGVPQC